MNRILASMAFLLAACGGSGGTGAGPGDVPVADLPPIDAVVFPDSHEAGGEDPGTPNDVPTEAACVPDCDSAGDRRCAGVQGAYQVCVEAGGCLRWSAPAFCDDGKACLDGECLAVCKTDPGCAAAGDRRCSAAAAFQECVEVAPGCIKLGEEEPCPGAAICVGDGKCECQHACEAGDRRCFAASPDLYQECREDEAGCRVWGEPATCGADAVCEGAGVCEEVCTPDCDAKGAVECASGTSYRICMEVQPGCLRWGEPVACPGTLTCDDGDCRVGCTSDPECDAAGKVGCADEGHERACEEVAPGCLKWGAAVACPLHQGCGAGGCACADGCAAEAAECIPDVDPHFRKVCDADDAGCLYWAYEDCGGGSVCEDGACVALCGSDPGCTAEGVTRCESLDSFSTCAAVEGDADCIQFGPPAPCAEHRECVEATGTCACRVEAGCTAADAKRCIDYDNAATCREDGGCLYWGPAEPCPEGNTCSGGVCGPLCVSDLDCPGVGAKRCSEDGRQQECVEVPGQAGCNKWAPSQACPPHQACGMGTGCVCKNACKTGESRCVGQSQYQSCSAPDAASCTFWSAPEPCPDGESCVKGACRLVVSPVVDCGSITFNLVNAGYSAVQVAGEFSAWQSVPMTLTDGVWSATVEVPVPGALEYKFVADGTWLLDPLNPSWTGEGPFENSLAIVEAVTTCEAAGDGRCTDGGALEVCAETGGCTAWRPAGDPCTAADRYCAGDECHAIASPVVTATDVTFTVRDQGFPVEVAGGFTSPPWTVFYELAAGEGRRSVTLARADLPGLTVGKHPYKFRTPGSDLWFFDPANPDREDDGQGGFNSILAVPSACPEECPADGKRCKNAATAESCEAGRDGCRAWTAAPCAADTHCLRDRCESFPVVDPVAKTATFVLPFEGSPAVRVFGSFTDPSWGADAALAMTQTGGNWTATSGALAPGTYQYKFRAEDGAGGNTWITDPNNPDKVDDTMGGFNSVFVIP